MSAARTSGRTPARATPPLAAKKQPTQQRSADTVELILEVTGRTLADVGFERLSTNLVCERAGLTPPALYRYFPNKYALLHELGQRLMQRQNEVVPRWVTPQVLTGSQQNLERALQGLLLDTHRVTREMVGGLWVMRALRAVPALQKVRLASHAQVTAAQVALLVEAFPRTDEQELRLVGRVAVELIYAAVEMLFEEPLNAQAVARIVAAMIGSQLGAIRGG